jgi:hypothetical protein
MSEKIFCEKCGTEMVDFQIDRSCGMECPKCGWGWATTYWSPIERDETVYSISIPSISNPTLNIIRFIAEVLSCNFIVANKKIKTSGIQLSGQAEKIQKIRKSLIELNANFVISPDFPYDINGNSIDLSPSENE